MYQINSKSSLKAALLLGAATATAMSLSSSAMAADQPVETVIVTGSLIPTPNATSNSPIQTVGAEQIDLSGHPNVEAVLNSLPQVSPGFGSTSNNPGTGVSTVDLRGLTPIRTLVLIDGRRAMPSVISPSEYVDVAQIPSALIDHVDVVSGGGSATYGSDAIAGVVNFVLKKDFEGFQAQARYGQGIQNSFSQQRDLNLTMGVNTADGKGNVTIFAEFYKRSGVLQGADPRFAIDFSGGSGTPPSGKVPSKTEGLPAIPRGGTADPADPCTSLSSTKEYAFLSNGNPVGFCNVLPTSSGNAKAVAEASKFETLNPAGNRYSFAAVNELVTPDTRHEFSGMGHYDIFPGIEAFAQFQYTKNVQAIQLAPTPITDGSALHFVVTPNPAAACPSFPVVTPGCGTAVGSTNFGVPGFTSFITPAFQNDIDIRATTINPATKKPFGYTPFIVSWRSAQVGARFDTFTNDVYTGTIGLRGQLPFVSGWDWEAWYMQGEGSQGSVALNNVLASHLAQAMLSCPAGSGRGCVPIDIFGAGNLTQPMIDFIGARTNDVNTFSRQMEHVSTHGNLGDYWGAGPISLAFGEEWRKDGGTFTPDQAKQNFDILGFNPARATSGSFNVWELFTEARIPVVKDLPFAEEVTLDGGYRFSRYDGAGDVNTWKGGAEWQPIDDIRFRVMWQRAVRAANINELFNGGSDNFPAITDPCATTLTNGKHQVVSPVQQIACTNQFAAVGQAYPVGNFTQQNGQQEVISFGNPNLRPEKSNTFTVGAVITPSFLPWLTGSVDYWHIAVSNFISSAFGGGQTVENDCINNQSGIGTRAFQELNPSFGNSCDLVTRTGSGDLLFSIPNENVNIGTLKTGGIDVQVNAQHELADIFDQSGDWGAVDANLAIQFLNEYIDPVVGPVKGQVDVTGITTVVAPSGIVRPNYKWTARFGWTFEDWRVMFTWNRIGGVTDNFAGVQIPSYDHVDMAVRWNISDKYAADLIVQNLLNKVPPLGPFANNDGGINTLNNTYDVLGTQAFIGITAKL